MEIINNITPQNFKDYFKREFNYLILWNEEISYKINKIVYYDELFYKSLFNNNLNNNPSSSPEEWLEYETNYNNYINDDDILKAFGQAKNMINIDLFSGNDELLTICFLMLSAHFLVIDLNMGKGNGASNFMMTSKSVDGVSASYGIPQKYLDNPLFNYLISTSFGLKYLSYLLPKLVGYMGTARGTTSKI